MFELLKADGTLEKLNEKDICRQGKTILYFYPKDNTPGCTQEAKDFNQLKDEFTKMGYHIIGISKDSIKSHKIFKEKLHLNIDIISDPDLILHKKFGTYGKKNNHGKIVMGVIRSTFIIDKDCNIIKKYINVKSNGHAEKILKECKKEDI